MEDEPNVEEGLEAEAVEEFEAELELAVQEAYPVLLQRLAAARFAGWHRQQTLESDLAQEATARLIAHCREKRVIPYNVLAYLVAIARNLAKQQYRERLKESSELAKSVVLQPVDSCVYPEEELEAAALTDPARQALFDTVSVAIDRLPRRQREALKLHLEEPSASQRELAKKMNIGEDGFQKNLSRAISRLQQLLARHRANATRNRG